MPVADERPNDGGMALGLPRTSRTAREDQPGIWPHAERRIHEALSALLREDDGPANASYFSDLILDMVSFAYGPFLASDGQVDRVDDPDLTDTVFTFHRRTRSLRFQVIVRMLGPDEEPLDMRQVGQ